MGNVRKHIDIKLARRRNYLVPEPNYHTTKIFTERLLVIKIKQQQQKKMEILMNKPVYLRFSIVKIK